MRMLDGMAATLQLVEDKGFPPGLDKSGSCSLEHLTEMHGKMVDKDFSDAKMGRWLGWAQGMLCGRGILTLEECKEINRKCTG